MAVEVNRDPLLPGAPRAQRHDLLQRLKVPRYLWKSSPADAHALKTLEPWLDRDEKLLREPERTRIAEVLPKSRVLHTMYAMRRELAAVWGRSTATREQLIRQLEDWCRRADASGIRPLVEFSQHLRSYA